jgi:hypothetical protein
MLSHHLNLCPSLSTPLVINVAFLAALMEAAGFLLNTHKFLPHYTVFFIIVPLRTSNLITWKLPPCVPGKNANDKYNVRNYRLHLISHMRILIHLRSNVMTHTHTHTHTHTSTRTYTVNFSLTTLGSNPRKPSSQSC